MSYAAADVLYLVTLADTLAAELGKAKRLEWAQEEFAALTLRQWPDREFDDLGYLRIKGARKLDPESLSVLRELFLMRDARARVMDRPPFKVIGNRTLLDLAEQRPTKTSDLSQIKGITDLLVRRIGREIVDAVQEGQGKEHGPIPKLTTGSRRRMDRSGDRRMAALKTWRTRRASELSMDPGVLCPNSALEAIAWANPDKGDDLAGLPELKGWFVREFGDEVAVASASVAEGDSES
jgi:ribonuclease D